MKIGDFIKIKTSTLEYEGCLMPSLTKDILVLKLKNGYNIGIEKKRIKNIKILKKHKNSKIKKKKIKHNKKLPTISILHTGGTIASEVDYRTGGVESKFTPEELIAMFPELNKIANIHSTFLSNMFSEDMRFKHYSIIAKAVVKEIKKGVKGVIIGHGTDTMHYTSAALSFMLENLPIPVILVGAQRSSDRPSSDAATNLICAAEFIAKTDFNGVGICMHESLDDDNCLILPACKTRKFHTSRRDAFKVVNSNVIAKINYKTKSMEFFYKYEKNKGPVRLLDKMEEKVALVKIHPNFMPEQFEFYKKNKYKGLIIEGTGLGQAPVGTPNSLTKIHSKNLKAIKDLVKSGCVVVMTSQCIFGRVQMHVYSNAIDLTNAGVISGEDMLSEVALIKLSWLLGNFNKKTKDLVKENFRGEINKRLMPEHFL
jgi:glutamyl-tRNA(Gln) amidotransferase subunit D|tara:strand:- start:20712 stop:21992 length:1281 start_codon:yes stop_codon:yes gene_type:complete